MSHEQALRTASNPGSNEMEDFTTWKYIMITSQKVKPATINSS